MAVNQIGPGLGLVDAWLHQTHRYGHLLAGVYVVNAFGETTARWEAAKPPVASVRNWPTV